MVRTLFKVDQSQDSLHISEVAYLPGKNKACVFLKNLNAGLKKHSISSNLNLEQIDDIFQKVGAVRNACKDKQPILYELQARNPYSNAYKIEKLSNKICGIAFSRSEAIKEKYNNNLHDPYEFFSVFPSLFKDGINSDRSNIGYLYYSNGKLYKSVSDIVPASGGQKYIRFPVKLYNHSWFVRLLREEEYSDADFSTYFLIEKHAKSIMAQIMRSDIIGY